MPDENQKKLLNRRKTGSILQTTAPHLNLGSLKVRKILASTCTCLITVKNMWMKVIPIVSNNIIQGNVQNWSASSEELLSLADT